jgi:DHA2 family multidrug resistance protein-like MFS transporter
VHASQVISGTKTAFLQGDDWVWSYLAGIIAVLLGAALVYVVYSERDEAGVACRLTGV